MRRLGYLIAVLSIALPVAATAWRAMNWHEVHDLGGGVYEVVGRVGSGPMQYWCGIGDYAISVLGVAAAQRIYVWRPIGPSVVRSGRKAVQFALSPPPGADTTSGLSLSVRRAGDNINAAMARQYCYDGGFDEDPWRRWP